MYSPISARFKQAIMGSGRRKTVVDAFYDNALVRANIPVSDGSIRVELDGQVRRSGSLTVADPGLVPTLSTTISPLGTEFLVKQGVVYSDGTEELIPLGRFRVDTASWSEGEDVTSVQLYDRSKALQVDLPGNTSRAGWMAQNVITDFLESFYPGITYAGLFFGVKDYRLPGGHVFEESSYWDAIQSLATNMGVRLYFDVTGTPRCAPLNALSASLTADLDVFAGPGGVLVSADREFTREGVYNAVTVTGTALPNGNIPTATVYNNLPNHPLRWGGPFGKVRQVIDDTSITNTGQATVRARAELSRYTGLSYSLDFSAVPNPALDVGDIVRFRFPSGEFQIHEVASLTIPLGRGEFSGTSKGGYLNG